MAVEVEVVAHIDKVLNYGRKWKATSIVGSVRNRPSMSISFARAEADFHADACFWWAGVLFEVPYNCSKSSHSDDCEHCTYPVVPAGVFQIRRRSISSDNLCAGQQYAFVIRRTDRRRQPLLTQELDELSISTYPSWQTSSNTLAHHLIVFRITALA